MTPKQEKFCQAIVQGHNQSEAHRLAYGVKKATTKTINERASRLMANSKVVARVEELRAPLVNQAQYDQARWLQQVQRCAFFDVRKLFDSHGNPIEIAQLSEDTAPALAGFEVQEVFAGKGESRKAVGYTKKFKLTDKLKALELYGKALGYYVDKSGPAPNALESETTEMLLAMRDTLQQRVGEKALIHARHS